MTKHRAKSKVDVEIAALIVGNFNLVVGICFVGFLWTSAWLLGIGALLCIIMGGYLLVTSFNKHQRQLWLDTWEVIKVYVESEVRKNSR